MNQQTLDRRAVASVITDLASGRHTKTLSLNPLSSDDENSIHSKFSPTLSGNDETASLLENGKSNLIDTQATTTPIKTQSVLISLSAGAMAGALAKTTIAPLDRTKIYFQATNRRYSFGSAVSFLKERYVRDGFFNLWRGNSATMARIMPYAAIQFTVHEQWKHVLRIDQPNRPTPNFLRFVAGSLAGVISQLLTYPLDMARARMAVTRRDTYSSLLQVFVKIWKLEGPRTLYRGLTPTILGVIPYAGTSFGIYGTLKFYHKEKTNRDTPNPLERMLFGATAGLFGQTSSYPLDIVRRRMQTANVTGNGNSYKTILGTLLKVYKEEGLIHGLYKGLSLNWVKGPIAVGISFATFDIMKQFLEELT